MTRKQRSPRKAGHGRKLRGWAHRNSTLQEWLPAALLAGVLIWQVVQVWQGVAR